MQETQETWVSPWVGKIPWRREWLRTLVFFYFNILLDRNWKLKHFKTVYVVHIYIYKCVVYMDTHWTHTQSTLLCKVSFPFYFTPALQILAPIVILSLGP